MLDLSGMPAGTVQCEVFDTRGAFVTTESLMGGTTNGLSMRNASGLHTVRLTCGSIAEVHRVVLR